MARKKRSAVAIQAGWLMTQLESHELHHSRLIEHSPHESYDVSWVTHAVRTFVDKVASDICDLPMAERSDRMWQKISGCAYRKTMVQLFGQEALEAVERRFKERDGLRQNIHTALLEHLDGYKTLEDEWGDGSDNITARMKLRSTTVTRTVFTVEEIHKMILAVIELCGVYVEALKDQ